MVEKHIIKNRTADRRRKRIIIMTSINFERISFFLEQLREYVAFQWVETLNLFLENKDIDRLLKLGFSAQTHRFNANSLALDLAGKTEAEMVSYLKNRFGDYFV